MRPSLVALGLAVTCSALGLGCAAPADEAESDGAAALSSSSLAPSYAGLLRSEVRVKGSDGREQTLKTTVRGFIAAEQNGNDVRFNLKACSFDLPSIDGIEIAIPSDVLQAKVPEILLRGRIDSTEEKTTFKTEETTVLVGLQNIKAGDPLPTDKKDPRVIDQDGDRDPGFSIRATLGVSGRVFVGLRAAAAAEGEVAKDGTVVAKGLLRYDFVNDIEFYGDSFFGVPASSIARQKSRSLVPVPGGEKYEIRLLPLRDGSFDTVAQKCAAVAKQLP